jgi:hypothetical protein
MKDNQQISEATMLSRFQVGTVLLPPLVIHKEFSGRGGCSGVAVKQSGISA